MTAKVGQDRAAQQRAITKAQKLGGVKLVVPITMFGQPAFSVPSSDGKKPYHITPAFVCDCPAGQRGIPCWHAASVWLYQMTFNQLPGPSEAAKRRHALIQRRKFFGKSLDESIDELEARRKRKQAADEFRKLLGDV